MESLAAMYSDLSTQLLPECGAQPSFSPSVSNRVPSGRQLEIIHQVEFQIHSHEDDAISSNMWRPWSPGCGERPLQLTRIRGVPAALESCACGGTKDRGTWRRHLLSGQHRNWSWTMCFHKILEVFVPLYGAIHPPAPSENKGIVSLHVAQLPTWEQREKGQKAQPVTHLGWPCEHQYIPLCSLWV